MKKKEEWVLYRITKAEAEYVRARTKDVHIRVCGKYHVARDKTYYIDESTLAKELIAEYREKVYSRGTGGEA